MLEDTERALPVACVSQTVPDARAIPIWSAWAYAARAQHHFHFATEPVGIPIDRFLERTLPFLAENSDLVGPDWDGNLAGLEIEPETLANALRSI